MTTIPVTILDDFFENPEAIKKYALGLEYKPSEDHRYPGVRSLELNSLNPYFTKFIHQKVLSLFFNKIPPHFIAASYFQIMDNFQGSGWVHQDEGAFTSMVYLSDLEPNSNSGTSFFKYKDDRFLPIQSPQEESIWSSLRTKHYIENSLSDEEFKIKQEYEDRLFKKTLSVPSNFNRLICFEGNQLHASNGSLENKINNRLTLITWFGELQSRDEPPVTRSKKVLSL